MKTHSLILLFVLTVASQSFAKLEISGKIQSTGYHQIEPEIEKILADKHNLENVIYLIDLIEMGYDPMNSDDMEIEIQVKYQVPAVKALIDNYGREVLPHLLHYALKTKSDYLKRRAVFTIEQISKMSMRDYLGRTIGREAIVSKFEDLANCLEVEVEYDYLKYFPKIGSPIDLELNFDGVSKFEK